MCVYVYLLHVYMFSCECFAALLVQVLDIALALTLFCALLCPAALVLGKFMRSAALCFGTRSITFALGALGPCVVLVARPHRRLVCQALGLIDAPSVWSFRSSAAMELSLSGLGPV